MIHFRRTSAASPVYEVQRDVVPKAVSTWLRTVTTNTAGWDATDTTFLFHHSNAFVVAHRLVVAGAEIDYSALPPYLVDRIRRCIPSWVEEQKARKSRTDSVRSTLDTACHYESLYLVSDAPPFLVTAAYRALTKEYHPDHGGDTDRMIAISKAYKAIKDSW